jgi:heat shock protein HslJ
MRSMRFLTICLVTCAFLAILAAGCTTQPVSPPGTTVPAATTPVSTPPATTAPIQDPALYGVWYLKAMTSAGGSTPFETMDVQINIIFNPGNLTGFDGCNDYSATYTLTGQVLPDGNGITIGPIATTLKYCADTSPTETSYLQVLQGATSYDINTNGELSITDRAGSILLYQRTPYNPLSVPPGA